MATVRSKTTITSYELIMSLEEASALMTVLEHVGGHPKSTRRGLTESIYSQLEAAGVTIGEDDCEGTVVFHEFDSCRRHVSVAQR